MRVLYLDVLFLVNFCMDYMALYIAGGLRERKRSAKRLFASSLVGAVYAMAAVIFTGNESVQTLIGIAVSVLMTGIAYGFGDRREFFRCFLTFYAVSLLLGALITVGYTLLNHYVDPVTSDTGDGRTLVFLAVAAVGGFVIRLSGKWLSRESTVKNCRVTVRLGRRVVSFSALVDSGNLLRDPLSGRRVIVVGLEKVRAVLPPPIVTMLASEPPDPTGLPPSLARRVRLIPMHGIGGTRILVGLLPDAIAVGDEDGKKIRAIDAILAIDTGKKQDYGGYDAVIPVELAA